MFGEHDESARCKRQCEKQEEKGKGEKERDRKTRREADSRRF
jgi:hypothetical protein